MLRILKRRPVDRVGAYESFWGDTHRKWAADGHIKQDENLEDHFGFDLRCSGWLNQSAWLDYTDEVLEETDETKLVRNANGAALRWWKNKAGTPEHVDFLVKDRQGWEEHIRPHLLNKDDYRRRINFEQYREVKAKCQRENLLFCWSGVNVFELMHPMCGHENMLVGMALDADWVKDMCNVYGQMIVDLQEILFAEAGKPDAIWFYEDMGFKERPFMSPAMYMDIVWPAHKLTMGYARSLGLEVIVHSCGYVEPLVPGLIKAGMSCLQAMEVKAGMNLVELKRKFGDKIAFMGGMDIRTLESNDLSVVEAELQAKLPAAMAGGGYCLETDHSVSDRVNYETYRYFLDRGRELGTY
jgi:uroporphyrinogen decarboxylase